MQRMDDLPVAEIMRHRRAAFFRNRLPTKKRASVQWSTTSLVSLLYILSLIVTLVPCLPLFSTFSLSPCVSLCPCPFCPPLSPLSPAVPLSPVVPCVPFVPLCPPLSPSSPLSPFVPLCPLCPLCPPCPLGSRSSALSSLSPLLFFCSVRCLSPVYLECSTLEHVTIMYMSSCAKFAAQRILLEGFFHHYAKAHLVASIIASTQLGLIPYKTRRRKI